MSVYPLTTAFVPPSSCFAPTYTLVANGGHDLTFKPPVGTIKRGVSEGCYPSGFQDPKKGSTITYSPGSCPSSYHEAVTLIRSLEHGDLTRALCCPGSMSIAWGSRYCHERSIRSTVTLVGAGLFTATEKWAQAILVEWQSTDYSVLNITSTSPTSTTPASTSGTKSSAAHGEGVNPTRLAGSAGSSDLSTGAKAGIGIGVAAFVIIIAITALVFGYRVWKRRKREAKETTFPGEGLGSDQKELGTQGQVYETHGQSRPPELLENPLYEVNGESKPVEIGDGTLRAEVDGRD